MEISKFATHRLNRVVHFLFERFDNSKWLLKKVYNIAISQKNTQWNPQSFYENILSDVVESDNFKNIFTELNLVRVPIVPKVIVNSYISDISALSRVSSNYDILKYFRWNKPINFIELTLIVPHKKPKSIADICFELESVIGHEITHIIQRLHRLKDEHHDPGDLKRAIRRLQKRDADIEMLNSIHYTPVYYLNNTDLDKEIAYYLRHGELIAHAYTIASKLSVYENWQHALKILYWYGWNGKHHTRLRQTINNNSITNLIIKYAILLRVADANGLISSNKSKKIWNKLFKEIYRNLKNKINDEIVEA